MFPEAISVLAQTVFSMSNWMTSTLHVLLQVSPKGPKPSGVLSVTDSRTGRKYEMPIHRNAVEAIRFKQIRAPKDKDHPSDKVEGGLRVVDHGFQNTAVMASQITYVDGIEGSIHYRNFSIVKLIEMKKKFEDVTFLLIWGHLPSQEERQKYKKDLAAAMAPPQLVSDVIQSFP